MKSIPKTIRGYPVVQREKDALMVWDLDAKEPVAYALGKSIRKAKALRERTGHRCVYLGLAPKRRSAQAKLGAK